MTLAPYPFEYGDDDRDPRCPVCEEVCEEGDICEDCGKCEECCQCAISLDGECPRCGALLYDGEACPCQVEG